VDDATVAETLALAHRSVTGAPAAVHFGDGKFFVPPSSDLTPSEVVVACREDLESLAGLASTLQDGAGLRVTLAVDPETPVELLAPTPSVDAPLVPEEVFGALESAETVAVLAGPGVVLPGPVASLHEFAAKGGLGVLNTWGAKGLFHWQSTHHWATVGLQERDFELAGLDQASLVLAIGLDEREAPGNRWRHHRHVVVAPAALSSVTERVLGQWRPLPVPPLRSRLAAATQAAWQVLAPPMPPSLATRNYSIVLPAGGLLAADAGTCGFWVARTFPTARLGQVLVPPAATPGWAVACGTVARLVQPWRPVLVVVDGPLDDAAQALLSCAEGWGMGLGVESWDPGGDVLAADLHRDRVAELIAPGPTRVNTLATDPRQLQDLVEVAGPVSAWTSPTAAAQ
jgi:hypothetical protein